jgi:hypothetical protein
VLQFPFRHFENEDIPPTAVHCFGQSWNTEGDPQHEYLVYAQSRKRIITPTEDNHGFARWVHDNANSVARVLGPGLHYGEWWGQGIQRGYGLDHKRFSLFNVKRWDWLNEPAARLAQGVMGQLHVVPVVKQYTFSVRAVDEALDYLRLKGSQAAPGFMNAEGVVVYHAASGNLYKALIEGADTPKSLMAA